MTALPAARRVPPGPSMLAALAGMGGSGGFTRLPGFLEGVARAYGPVASWRLVARRQQHREQVAAVGLLAAALLDEPVDHRVELRARRAEAARRGMERHVVQQLGERPEAGREGLHRGGHRGADRIGVVVDVGGEQRRGGDPQRQAVHQRVDLDRLAVAQPFRGGPRQRDHRGGVAGDPLAVERRLHEPPLAQVQRLVAGEQPFTQQPPHPAQPAALDRVVAAGRQHRVDQRGVVEEPEPRARQNGAPMPTELVRDEALTLLLAGHETTANALTWTWDALARNPVAEARLHAELDAVLGDRDPAPDDVTRLPFARDVVAESMRLRPPAWILGRRVIRPIRLGAWDVPAGSVLLAAQIVTHRNPRYWSQPEAFRPERWSNGETAGLPRGAYFPFGGGNRICIGESFAWTEAVLVLAMLARRVRFRGLDPAPVPLEPLVTLRPGRPVRMRVEARRAEVCV